MTIVQMPALGESVSEGTVLAWLKEEGDTVSSGEPLLQISTDKVDTEIPSPIDGTLSRIIAPADTVVEVGGRLAFIDAVNNRGDDRNPSASERVTLDSTGIDLSQSSRVLASPAARRKAQELAIVLGDIRTAAPIRLRDILVHADTSAGPAPTAPPHPPLPHPPQPSSTTRPASRLRQLTADRTVASLRESAQLTQTFEIDMTSIAVLRNKIEADFERREGVALTFLSFVAKAAVEALADHPNINAGIDSAHTTITYHETVSLGITVDTPRGLLTPVISDAGNLSLPDLARSIAELAEGARNGTLTADQVSGGTFTVTDIGSQGALFDTPILIKDQAAMLGLGAIVRRPAVMTDRDGRESIGIRSMCYLPMTYDHRLIDGADAGRFLTAVKTRLESGLFHGEVGLDSP